MIRVIFDDDLIKYIYQECNPTEEKNVEASIKTNEKIYDTLLEYMKIKEMLHDACQSPSHHVVTRILEYVRKKKGMANENYP